ncbi:MAG: hypothetical protein DRQ46_10625 [Gammaproteobacteria bacterium]|nr:MAG: hypothetical protein DRQ46_10625 [Gammaproteobacteria bacterium]
MESSVGYSQGQGTRIATHEIDMGSEVLHHQRFASGTGVLNMLQCIVPTGSTNESDLLDCLGAGRIVVSAQCSTTGAIIKVHFFDKNNMNIGMSDEVEITAVSNMPSYGNTSSGWSASTTTPANNLLRISSNSHVYMNMTVDGNNAFIGGTTGAVEPTWPTDGSTVVDNDITWKDLGVYTGLYHTPLLVFSNSLGASNYYVEITTASGTTTIFADAI